MKVTEIVTQFAQPIVEANGCTLWDCEYVREGSERFLRLYIDKEGGVSIDDCEAISLKSVLQDWNGPCAGPRTLPGSWAAPSL